LSFRVEGDHVRYDGDYQGRARRPSSDVDLCFRGSITVSRIELYPASEAPRSD
jgi:hypothetical protein